MSVSGNGPALTGFARADGRFGIRDHILVLPSVVCSTHAAAQVARAEGAIAITHQHGCLHVGDDLRHTEGELIGTATNPNVGGVVVVGLGCETIQGRRLATRIGERGQRVAFVGIQAEGGTARAIERARAEVVRLRGELDREARVPLPAEAVAVGIDSEDDPALEAIGTALRARGLRPVVTGGRSGPEAHVALAGAGAQVIVSLRGPGQPPMGFAVCPVIAVGRDPELFAALRDDFDLDASGLSPDALADRIGDAVLAVCDGQPTASEQRGARDFVLRRLAMTM